MRDDNCFSNSTPDPPLSPPQANPILCQPVPSAGASMCQGVPSSAGVDDPKCADECRKVPDSAIGSANFSQCKTNPTSSRPLTDTQLSVARWLVAGYGS